MLYTVSSISYHHCPPIAQRLERSAVDINHQAYGYHVLCDAMIVQRAVTERFPVQNALGTSHVRESPGGGTSLSQANALVV